MEINTVKIQGDGYLVNGMMLVPIIKGNRHYEEVLVWIEEGGIIEDEFTQAEIDAKVITDANNILQAELVAMDLASIRDLREIVVQQFNAPQTLVDREALAVLTRGKIV